MSNVATFAVRLSVPSNLTCTVAYTTVDETAVGTTDYTIETGVLTFPPGVTVKTITVPVLASPQAGVNKKFKVVLSAPVNATLPSNASGECIISTLSASQPTVSVGPGVLTSPPVVALSPLSALGNQIVDSSGNIVRLQSLNWYGMEGTSLMVHGLYAGRGYKDVLDQIKGLGFNSVRIPFCDDLLTSTVVFNSTSGDQYVDANGNPDLIGLTPLQGFDKVIAYCGAIGLRVILDHHRISMNATTVSGSPYGTDDWPGTDPTAGTYLYGGSTTPRPYTPTTWGAMWQSFATHCTTGAYATDPMLKNVICGFDPHNEPHNLLWSVWAGIVETLCPLVHAIAPDWLVFVEGVAHNDTNTDSYWYGGYLKGVTTRPINLGAKQNKVVYSAHEYAHSVAPQTWLSSVASAGGTMNGGIYPTIPALTVPNYPNNLEAVWDAYWGFIFKNNIAPVWVGEFGGGFGVDYSTGAADALQVNGPFEIAWVTSLVKYMNGGRNDGTSMVSGVQQGISFAYFALNPESGNPLGGLLENVNYLTVQSVKMTLILPLLP